MLRLFEHTWQYNYDCGICLYIGTQTSHIRMHLKLGIVCLFAYSHEIMLLRQILRNVLHKDQYLNHSEQNKRLEPFMFYEKGCNENLETMMLYFDGFYNSPIIRKWNFNWIILFVEPTYKSKQEMKSNRLLVL